MPLIHYIPKNDGTKIGIWNITEPEDFFAQKIKISKDIHNPHKRLQHLAARYLLSRLEPNLPMDEIIISESNKPYLPGNNFHFSVAHCGDYATAIVSPHYRVGIDVEKISSKVEKVSTKFLEPDELNFIDKKNNQAHLTLCWCTKEAVFKWDGDGGMDFRKCIHLSPFPFLPKGRILCHFRKKEIRASLIIHYIMRDDFCIAWLVDE